MLVFGLVILCLGLLGCGCVGLVGVIGWLVWWIIDSFGLGWCVLGVVWFGFFSIVGGCLVWVILLVCCFCSVGWFCCCLGLFGWSSVLLVVVCFVVGSWLGGV